MCKISEKHKDKFMEIILKIMEYKFLKNHFNKIIFISGIGLISPSLFRDFLYQIIGIKYPELEYITYFIGIVLIVFSLVIFISDHYSSPSVSQEIVYQTEQKNKDIIYRRDKLIASRLNIIFILISLIIIIFAIYAILFNICGYTNLLLMWFFLATLVVVIKPMAIILVKIIYLKKNKLLILYKNKCIEYGKDRNIYLTEYNFRCPECNNISHIKKWDAQSCYYLQCTEYPNDTQHKKLIVISDFNKFSNP